MARSAPSYAPMARARWMAGRVRRQRGHGSEPATERRHVRSGSPQRSHSGGVRGRIDCQHSAQTGPRVGCSSGRSHAAHAGDKATLRSASESADTRDSHGRGVARRNNPSGRVGACRADAGCWRWGRDAPSVRPGPSPVVRATQDQSRSMAADSRATIRECRLRTAGCRLSAGEGESVSRARPARRSPTIARGRRRRAARARRCAR